MEQKFTSVGGLIYRAGILCGETCGDDKATLAATIATALDSGDIARPLAPGDVVQLKSGGPPMTVEKLTDNDSRALCVRWVDFADGRWERESFALCLLRRVDAPAPPSVQSGEPDGWDWAAFEEGEPQHDAQEGYAWAGPWEMVGGVWDPGNEAVRFLLRRPLRKLANG